MILLFQNLLRQTCCNFDQYYNFPILYTIIHEIIHYFLINNSNFTLLTSNKEENPMHSREKFLINQNENSLKIFPLPRRTEIIWNGN